MKKVLYLSIILSAMLFSASCQREGAIFEFPSDLALVSFPSDVANIQMVQEDGNKFSVELWRGNTKGSVSIPVDIVYDVEGVFTSKGTFDFADGDAVAYLDFNYKDVNDFGGEVYSITISVADENQVSPAGISSVTVEAQRKLTPVLLGTGLYYTEFFDESWEQDLYTTVEAPNFYILPDCWFTGYDFTFSSKDGKPLIPASPWDSGYSTSGYEVFIKTNEISMTDGVITFTADYILPEYKNGYILYSSYEEYTLPEGVVLK